MRQFRHNSYDHYRRSQVDTSWEKSTNVWVRPDELKDVAKVITKSVDGPLGFGICHGVRTGKENKELSKLLNIEVVGTDLVGRNEVVKMDFHDEAPQWAGMADFVYTNSLDHSYSPKLAIRRWIKCLRPGGIILIHWDIGDEIIKPDAADCFKASETEYKKMLSAYGKLKVKRTQRYRPKKKTTIEVILFILTPSQ